MEDEAFDLLTRPSRQQLIFIIVSAILDLILTFVRLTQERSSGRRFATLDSISKESESWKSKIDFETCLLFLQEIDRCTENADGHFQ